MNKILVVNMNYLGDALLSTPVLATLRASFPGAQIHTVAGDRKGYAASAVLSTNPHVDKIISRSPGGAADRVFQLFGLIRSGKYDCVVVLPSIAVYEMAARLAGAKKVLTVSSGASDVHLTDKMFTVLSGIVEPEKFDFKTRLPIPPAEKSSMREKLAPYKKNGPLIGFNLGASRPQKRWPVSHFIEAVKMALDSGADVALLGGSQDGEASECIRSNVRSERIIDLVGKTSIMELAAAISECDALISADTGAMHIAVAVNCPVVALFGSTDPAVSGPYRASSSRVVYKSMPCSPCNSRPTCGGAFTCMTKITPAEVFEAASQLLASADPG